MLGRETYLTPVSWVDGWPVVGPLLTEQPAPPWPLHPLEPEPAREDFGAATLPPAWVSLRLRTEATCSTREHPGRLTLHAAGASLDEPDVTFAGRRQQHLSCPGPGPARRVGRPRRAGRPAGRAAPLRGRGRGRPGPGAGPDRPAARRPGRPRLPPGPVVLRVETAVTTTLRDARTGPDTVTLGLERPDGSFDRLAVLDGRYLSTEVAGGFTGRLIGLYAAAGTVSADWFEYGPADPTA